MIGNESEIPTNRGRVIEVTVIDLGYTIVTVVAGKYLNDRKCENGSDFSSLCVGTNTRF